MLFSPKIVKETAVRKSFSFKINEVNLDFTLRIDEPTQMQDFLRVLEIAKTEVEAELNAAGFNKS